MLRKIILLEHINEENNDQKLLGCFSEDILPETINFYCTLPGFEEHKNGFKLLDSLHIDSESVYVLQIWNKHDDDIIYLEKMFARECDAVQVKREYYQEHTNLELESVIEKYPINKKYWAEGFFSYY